MRKSLLPEIVEAHIAANLVHQTPIEADLYERSMQHERAGMCSSPEVGHLLAFLVRLMGAKRVLEVGVFTGYSGLKMASALPEAGKLVACDISAEFPAIGQPFWERAGVADRIDLRLGDATETLRGLDADSFDFAFIDADKTGYPTYFEHALRLVRRGGLIVLDNMLRGGRVAEVDSADEETRLLRDLGIQISRDPRVNATMLAVGDGLMLAQRI